MSMTLSMTVRRSAASPDTRMLRVPAREPGLSERIDLLAAAMPPIETKAGVAVCNPLAKLPTLTLADGVLDAARPLRLDPRT